MFLVVCDYIKKACKLLLKYFSDSTDLDSDAPPEKRNRKKFLKEVEKEKKMSKKKVEEVCYLFVLWLSSYIPLTTAMLMFFLLFTEIFTI